VEVGEIPLVLLVILVKAGKLLLIAGTRVVNPAPVPSRHQFLQIAVEEGKSFFQ
jgi:hypothetical protein